ncbi:MAG TPA: ATP-binding protein [Anaerolineales bacterium]|jgi:signal transduction histidine kinase/HAMP domain-containing protein/predicted membrane protein
MEIILWLFDTYPTPFWPITIVGWLGWFIFLGLISWLVWNRRHLQLPWNARNIGLLGAMAFLVIICNLFVGIRLPLGSALPLPGIPQEPLGPAVMLLSAAPLLLAGGVLGPVAAVALGLLAGVLRFLWDTHSIFTALELALIGVLFSLGVRQRYRTRIFVLLREPLFTATLLALFFVPIYIIDAFLVSSGSMAARLDYALAGVGPRTLAQGAELLLAGLFMQVLVAALPAFWGRNLPLQPSPVERSLEARFLFGAGTLIIVLLLALLAGDWLVAGTAAREMLHNRLKGTAELSAQSVPFFLETGQNLAVEISKKPEMLNANGETLSKTLGDQDQAISYFDQLLVFDRAKNLLGSSSSTPQVPLELYLEENAGLDLAYSGVLSQVYTIPPAAADQDLPARISFIVAIMDPLTNEIVRALIARTDLATNPFTLPLITSLKSMSELGGIGILLDESGRILFHPVYSQVMSLYSGQQRAEPAFFDDTAPNGTRNLVYYQPVTGRSWAVVLTLPAQQAQQLALSIAAPLSMMILVLAFIALASLRLGLRGITTSLQTLAIETVRIAQGQLDHSLTVEGVDEVGQLRRSFEQMRISLQARLAELNRLLLVSQGVASSLDVQDAVQPVMEAVLATGAGAVRMVMPPQAEEYGQNQTTILALGPDKDAFASFDDEVMLFSEHQERLFVPDARNSLGLESSQTVTAPVSLFAVALRHENQMFGVLWAGYGKARQFSDSDVRFLTTLAGQAALAASNHHLFRTAEVGRQRLAAILASTPDPVLVIDQFNNLLLANPAASQVLGNAVETGKGQPVEKIITQAPLLDILRAASTEKLSVEVYMPGKRVYLATASPVVADDIPVGRVCILRDVTHFKELDSMKTEFVNTVSHDLRSPLTLIRGYASMLEMFGTLNEQQQGYARKITAGVENMSRLVNTLLDLGRVEAGVGLQLEIIPLMDLLEKLAGPLQQLAAQKNIELTVTTPKNTRPLIEADGALIQQALYNLVENAIKYTSSGGKVDVRLQILSDALLFSVKDNGIGIDRLDQPHIFEKFYRSSQREAREQKGSGLGLAIVKSIAEHHGGKVWLESQLGKGSTFYLQVPMRQPARNRK